MKAAFFTPWKWVKFEGVWQWAWGLPILVEDEPGTGKTSLISQFTEEWRSAFKWLSPGAHGEGVFGVIPVPGKDGTITYPRPSWAKMFDDGQRGLVLVDEISSADRGLQPPMLGLVGEHQLGDDVLPPPVRVWGACNPVHLAANGDDLAPPLANRFGWLRWDAPTVDEHRAYMMGRAQGGAVETKDPAAEEARVLDAWPEAWAWAVAMESGYLQSQPHMKNQCPKEATAQGRAWPSDRTMEMATRALASARVHGLKPEVADEFVAAFIGHKAQAMWATFIADAKMPNMQKLLDGEVKWEPEVERLDRAAAVLAGATATLVGDTDKKRQEKRAQRAWKEVFSKVVEFAPDLVVPSSQQMIRSSLHAYKEAIPVLAKTHPVTSTLSGER